MKRWRRVARDVLSTVSAAVLAVAWFLNRKGFGEIADALIIVGIILIIASILAPSEKA